MQSTKSNKTSLLIRFKTIMQVVSEASKTKREIIFIIGRKTINLTIYNLINSIYNIHKNFIENWNRERKRVKISLNKMEP